MPTYRVYLARPVTLPPAFDWAQTVAAKDADFAYGYAYADWINSGPTYPIPPFSQCRKEIRVAGTVNLLGAAAISPGQQAFIDDIQSQVGKFLATQLDGAFSLISYPPGFNYGITYGNNGYYNVATLKDIDALLGVSSSGQLDLTGAAFSTLYAQILNAVTFSFSQQDTATMNRQDTAASAQIAAILTEYANAGGTYPDPLPLGGKLQYVFDTLTKQFGSLEKLPDSLNALRNAIASYKVLAADSYALHNRFYAASERIKYAYGNTFTPTAKNGGQQVNANDYYVGYTPAKLPSTNQLIGGLNTASNAVSVQIDLSSFNAESTQMRISGNAGIRIPVASILGISVSGGASYDLSRYTSSSSEVKVDITYPGITLFASQPSPLSTDNSSGWYANDILQEVATKTGQDATGYKLQGSEFNVNELFGPGKAFSRLKTFVISQPPTITMTFTGADASRITSDLQVNASIKLDLFKLFSVGSASSNYSVQKVDSESQSGSVKVTFGPPQASGTIPLEQQVAYVLGGVASYPPEHI